MDKKKFCHVSQKEQVHPQGKQNLIFVQLSFNEINEGEKLTDHINVNIFSFPSQTVFPEMEADF